MRESSFGESLPKAPVSYARVRDGIWSGGTYVCWGRDNREAPVRLCGSERGKSSSDGEEGGGGYNFELKCVDATSCVYVALAGILGVGAHAVEKGALLMSGDCRKPVALMSEEERRAAGVHNAARLPQTIGEARALLRADGVLGEVLGREVVGAYLSVNEVRRVPGTVFLVV